MQKIKRYVVVEITSEGAEKQLDYYFSQAPATSLANALSRHNKNKFEVWEQEYLYSGERQVRVCIGGQAFPCS